jgi:hypothetical protein
MEGSRRPKKHTNLGSGSGSESGTLQQRLIIIRQIHLLCLKCQLGSPPLILEDVLLVFCPNPPQSLRFTKNEPMTKQKLETNEILLIREF